MGVYYGTTRAAERGENISQEEEQDSPEWSFDFVDVSSHEGPERSTQNIRSNPARGLEQDPASLRKGNWSLYWGEGGYWQLFRHSEGKGHGLELWDSGFGVALGSRSGSERIVLLLRRS